MRRICLVPAMLVMSLAVMPGIASAQGGLGAPDFKDRETNEFVEDDFCETGASVQVVESIEDREDIGIPVNDTSAELEDPL